MEILDHIILADKTYYGFDENQYMEMIYESLKYKTYNNIKPRIDKEKKDYGREQKIRGKKVGLKKGRLEGFTEGEKVGIDKEKIAIAKSMLADNIDIKIISKHTGFSEEEINKLK